MSLHLERAIDDLKKQVLVLSARVEETVRQAAKSLARRDAALAQQVVDADFEIDHQEVAIEEECLKILALYQPVAGDLRFIITVLKINSDLERIGDVASNIASRALSLTAQPPVELSLDFPRMAERSQSMLGRSLDALVNLNPDLAREVCLADDEVDAMKREMYARIKAVLRQDTSKMEVLLELLGVARHFERIADLATNIAEDVIYLAEGDIVRHRTEEFKPQSERP